MNIESKKFQICTVESIPSLVEIRHKPSNRSIYASASSFASVDTLAAMSEFEFDEFADSQF